MVTSLPGMVSFPLLHLSPITIVKGPCLPLEGTVRQATRKVAKLRACTMLLLALRSAQMEPYPFDRPRNSYSKISKNCRAYRYLSSLFSGHKNLDLKHIYVSDTGNNVIRTIVGGIFPPFPFPTSSQSLFPSRSSLMLIHRSRVQSACWYSWDRRICKWLFSTI